jgi:NADH-quinone oxidoreductase subunit L
MNVGGLKMEVGFLVDGLTAMMMCVVTFVSLMVHIYTIGYMEEDEGYNRFFAYISLFTFSMLMLVMSNNMLQLFFGWEAVGLVSYLLIGFWFNKPTAIFANMKAFLVNRVGDFGFILGIGLIAAYAGTLNYGEAFAKAGDAGRHHLPGHRVDAGDRDLHLPVHRRHGQERAVPAARVAARFDGRPDAHLGADPRSDHGDGRHLHGGAHVAAVRAQRHGALFILVIGAITALFMGFLGIIQNDIKRVVAYSTLSQLGYMTVALGASAYSVAVFHLMTHAFFKALLFLGAGSVIIGMHHNQDIRWMGGVRKYMPITWITSLLGSLALIGTPLFAGFYSKDSIIEAVHESHLWGAQFAYYAVLAGVFVTAFYSFRMYFLVFHGKERYDQNPDAHHDDHAAHGDDHGHGHDDHKPHESPWVVTAAAGAAGDPVRGDRLHDDRADAVRRVLQGRHRGRTRTSIHAMEELGEAFHGPVAMAMHGLQTPPFWLALAGVALSVHVHDQSGAACRDQARVRPVYRLLDNKYYLDWINENIVARGARALGTGLWKGGDQALIDGAIVNGSWKVVGRISGVVRWLQSGYIYHYAFSMLLGIFILMTYFVWFKR